MARFRESSVVPSYLVRKVENMIFPCMFNFGKRKGQVWLYHSPRVPIDEKELRRICLPIGQDNTNYILCPIRSQHSLDLLEMGKSQYPGARLLSVLKNFRRAFSLEPVDCPWVSEDVPWAIH